MKELEHLAAILKGVDTGQDQHPGLERLARACWLAIAEPGDRVANELLDVVSATAALRTFVSSTCGTRFVAQLLDAELVQEGALPDVYELTRAWERWSPRQDLHGIVERMAESLERGHRVLIPTDKHWPEGLRDLRSHMPLALWSWGSGPTHLADGIAVVGARAATHYGTAVTADLVSSLGGRGHSIVSGGAYGIDAVAHRVAIASGVCTVAFLAGGLHRPYPAGHRTLFDAIREHGALLSESPWGAAPTRWRFLQRNRLIAAASRVTILTEGGPRSGSLNTASHAAALGRPLGAVPGPVTSTTSSGCHEAIRTRDATLIRTASDVCELANCRHDGADAGAGADLPALAVPSPPGLATRVWDALAPGSDRSTDEVARECGMSIREVLAVLGSMQSRQLVVRGSRGWRRSSVAD